MYPHATITFDLKIITNIQRYLLHVTYHLQSHFPFFESRDIITKYSEYIIHYPRLDGDLFPLHISINEKIQM